MTRQIPRPEIPKLSPTKKEKRPLDDETKQVLADIREVLSGSDVEDRLDSDSD